MSERVPGVMEGTNGVAWSTVGERIPNHLSEVKGEFGSYCPWDLGLDIGDEEEWSTCRRASKIMCRVYCSVHGLSLLDEEWEDEELNW